MNLNERPVTKHIRRGWVKSQYKVFLVQAGTVTGPSNRSWTNNASSASSIQLKEKSKSTGSSVGQTPNSSLRLNASHEKESHMVIALSEGRGEATCEVGIAALDLYHPSIILSQISDQQSYINTLTKINILDPKEIIIPMTFLPSNRLTEKLKIHFPHVKISAVPRSFFNSNGLQNITHLCAPYWKSTLLTIKQKYYVLTSGNALITYLENNHYANYAKETLKVEFQVSEGHTMIDVATADSLELATTAAALYTKYSSLMSILNHCKTRSGARLLRASILQPPCLEDEIESRLDCVELLLANPRLFISLQEILYKLCGIDQLLSLSSLVPDDHHSSSGRHLNYLIFLNMVLSQLPALRDCIIALAAEEEERNNNASDHPNNPKSTSNPLQPSFAYWAELLSDETFTQLAEVLHEMIHENAHPAGAAGGLSGEMERCFAIKSGVNALLDLVRTTYTGRIDEMKEYVKGLASKYGLNLNLVNTNKKGYHISLPLNKHKRATFKKSELPPEFMQIDRLIGSVTMKTPELVNLTSRIEDITEEIVKLSNIILRKVLIEIRKYMNLFYALCECVAKLDMLQSLAEASSAGQAVRPTFGDYTQVFDSRHPLLGYLCTTEPVPNDIHVSSHYNMNIITGANASGKSVFIRQIVLLQVMAQIGCYVPASKAQFRIADRILARISLGDDMDNGASGFVLEMREIDYFFKVLTNNTLIIIDELSRSTSVLSGTAISIAVCEKLLKSNAFVFLTTHFTIITKLADMYLNVKNWQMETIENMQDNKMNLIFTHIVKPGVLSLKKYGIYFARFTWPQHVVNNVENILNHQTLYNELFTEVKKVDPRLRLKYDCEADLYLLSKKKQRLITEILYKYQEELLKLEENCQELNISEKPRNVDLANKSTLSILQPELVYSESTKSSSATRYDISSSSTNMEVESPIVDIPSSRINESFGKSIRENVQTSPKKWVFSKPAIITNIGKPIHSIKPMDNIFRFSAPIVIETNQFVIDSNPPTSDNENNDIQNTSQSYIESNSNSRDTEIVRNMCSSENPQNSNIEEISIYCNDGSYSSNVPKDIDISAILSDISEDFFDLKTFDDNKTEGMESITVKSEESTTVEITREDISFSYSPLETDSQRENCEITNQTNYQQMGKVDYQQTMTPGFQEIDRNYQLAEHPDYQPATHVDQQSIKIEYHEICQSIDQTDYEQISQTIDPTNYEQTSQIVDQTYYEQIGRLVDQQLIQTDYEEVSQLVDKQSIQTNHQQTSKSNSSQMLQSDDQLASETSSQQAMETYSSFRANLTNSNPICQETQENPQPPANPPEKPQTITSSIFESSFNDDALDLDFLEPTTSQLPVVKNYRARAKRSFKVPFKEGEAGGSKPAKVTRQFKAPRMLTKQEIERDFYEQDCRFLENSNYDCSFKQIMNRPSVQQLQRAEVIFHMNKDGQVRVVPPRVTQRRKFMPPLKNTSYDSEFMDDFRSKLKEDAEKMENKSRSSSVNNYLGIYGNGSGSSSTSKIINRKKDI